MLSDRMRIAVASIYDPDSVASWSGIPFHVLSQLRGSGAELTILGPLKRSTGFRTALRRVGSRALGFRYLTHRDIQTCQNYGFQLTQKLKNTQSDCMLGFGTAAVSFVETSIPVVLYNDATFAALVDYYPAWSNLPGTMLKMGHEIEKRSFERADSLIFTSEWAAASAREHYGVPHHKIHVIPMGANLVRPDRGTVLNLARAKGEGACELLFIGYDWRRKGGDIALRIRRRLCEHGVDTRLTIVGCDPFKSRRLEEGITVCGELDKRKLEDVRRLELLLRRGHFLLHPARAECYGIVLCEANAFGLPVITSSTGGIPSIVKIGVNGYFQDDIDDIDGFCNFIMKHLSAHSYTTLALNSYDYYSHCLDWHANRGRIVEAVRAAMRTRSTGA